MKFIVTVLLFAVISIIFVSENSFAFASPISEYEGRLNLPNCFTQQPRISKDDRKGISNISLALLAESVVMNQLDVYAYTLANQPIGYQTILISSEYLGDGRTQLVYQKKTIYGFGKPIDGNWDEMNPISKFLMEKDLGFICGPLSAGAVYGIALLLNDKVSPVAKDIFLSCDIIAEILAIHSWGKQGLGPLEQTWTIYATVF